MIDQHSFVSVAVISVDSKANTVVAKPCHFLPEGIQCRIVRVSILVNVIAGQQGRIDASRIIVPRQARSGKKIFDGSRLTRPRPWVKSRGGQRPVRRWDRTTRPF